MMILRKVYEENREEYWNIVTHGISFFCALFFMILLLAQESVAGDHPATVSILLFGCSAMLVYFSSTLYHYKWSSANRQLYRTIDHVSIFFLIAGSYAPFLLISFPEASGWKMMKIIWGLAAVGALFKLFNTGKYENLSLLFYILMGWAVLLEFRVFIETTPTLAFSFILIGGLLYLLGVVFYKWKSLPYNHAVWHIFVLLANMAHFIAVYTIL